MPSLVKFEIEMVICPQWMIPCCWQQEVVEEYFTGTRALLTFDMRHFFKLEDLLESKIAAHSFVSSELNCLLITKNLPNPLRRNKEQNNHKLYMT